MDRIGASGRYPQGKLDDSDEGELTMAVTRDGDVIRIDFGKPVAWLAMSAEEALGLARLLVERANNG